MKIHPDKRRALMAAAAERIRREPNSHPARMTRAIAAWATAQRTEAADGKRAPSTRSAYALAGRLLAEAQRDIPPTH